MKSGITHSNSSQTKLTSISIEKSDQDVGGRENLAKHQGSDRTSRRVRASICLSMVAL
jgi:hypothetical protein